MKAKFENKTKMIDVVIALCLKYPAIIALIPALEAFFTALQSIRAEIHDVNEVYIKIITGIAKDKRNSKEKCAKLMLKFAKAMRSYATKNNNQALKKEMTLSKSRLMNKRALNFYDLAVLIYSRATDITADLVPFGIIAADFNELVAAYKDFRDRIPEPKSAKDAKKTSIIQITALLKQASEMLKDEMDPLVYDVLPEENQTFKLEWKSARIIIDQRGPRRKKKVVPGFGVLQGRVSKAADDSPIKDAIVTIVEPNISTKSDDSGIFIFEKVAAGFYTVKASAVTYLPVTLKKVAVNGNAETNLSIGMEPEVSPV
ncbi:MAG: carboxypeptidase-like regulatory domain-containing protein [Bacteroidota bacterium]